MIVQDFTCAICGEDLPSASECDHIIPFSLGGDTNLSNLQEICVECHRKKSILDGSCRPMSN